MRKGGGKQKGNSFEREVAVALSIWLSDGQKSDCLWRSATSGGRATVAMKRGKKLSNQVGDLSSIDPLSSKFINSFAIEIKFYADLDYKGLITGRGKLLEFWTEIRKQSKTHGKHPLLIAKQNRMPAVICLTNAGMEKLGLGDHTTILISRPFNLYLLGFSNFISLCEPFV